jgi:membrane protein
MIIGLLIFRVLRRSISDLGLRLSLLFQMPEISEFLHEILKDGGLITTVGMGFIVVMTYTFLQGQLHRIRRQLPGAVFTTILWIIFSELFEWFISEFWNASALYGSLAALFLTALWLRTIMTILFLGAALNEVLSRMMHPKERQKGEPSS